MSQVCYGAMKPCSMVKLLDEPCAYHLSSASKASAVSFLPISCKYLQIPLEGDRLYYIVMQYLLYITRTKQSILQLL